MTSPLRVSANRRFLERENGTPFFYLGDTAWELFHRPDRADADAYLADRAAKGFTVIQAVALAEMDGIRTPNAYGQRPFVDEDPHQPNEAYWAHVDWVVRRANALGLVIGLLPTWGDKWNKGQGPEIFTDTAVAQMYGKWIGARYRDADLVWILGGDRPLETPLHREIIDAMAEGLAEGDGGIHLRSFHPVGGQSSIPLHDAPWLDFHMWQSGHTRNNDNGAQIAQTYALTPPKPCLDAEPGYEDHPASFDPSNGYLDEYDNRKALYWALFAGACGHTYGCHPIWQFASSEHTPISWCRHLWPEALHLPGSGQMRHGKALVLSRPYLSRVPAPELIVSPKQEGTHRPAAARGEDDSYAFVYVPSNRSVTVDLGRLSGVSLNAWWFDPRSGTAESLGTIPREGTHEFTPPAWGPDWVLCLDDAAKGYGRPGKD
ncbi:glycoside hydrolase family 140 protein [soil metagenome]